jgi:hypothetical protein
LASTLALIAVAATPLVVAVLGFVLVREGLRKASERGGEVEFERRPWRTYIRLSFPITPPETRQDGRKVASQWLHRSNRWRQSSEKRQGGARSGPAHVEPE